MTSSAGIDASMPVPVQEPERVPVSIWSETVQTVIYVSLTEVSTLEYKLLDKSS